MATKKLAKRPAPAHLPEPRGVRGQRRIDQDPTLRALIVEWLKEAPRPSYLEMQERARATGFAVGRSAIWDWAVDFEIKQAERDLALEMANKYNATAPAGEVLDIETAIAMMANVEIYRDLAQAIGKGIDNKTAVLLQTFYRLQTSSANRERAKFYVTRGVRRAMLELIPRLATALKKHPEAAQIVVSELRALVSGGSNS